MEFWLILSLTAILMYGSSMVAQKLSLGELSTPSMILFSLLIALPMFLAVLVALALSGDIWSASTEHLIYGLVGAAFGQMGYYTYIEAAKRGPISIVGSATASYPVMVAVVALVFLGESMTLLQGLGVVVIMVSIVSLSYFHEESDGRASASAGYYAICLVTVLLWGLWAIFTKLALLELSNMEFLALYGLVIPPITLGYYKLSGVKMRSAWPKWGRAVQIAIVSTIVGNLAYFVEVTAIDSGPAVIVFPLIASSPVIVVLLAFAFLKERLTKWEWLLVVGFILGIVTVSTV